MTRPHVYTHRLSRATKLLTRGCVLMLGCLVLRIPIDLEHKRLQEALDWDRFKAQTKEEAMEKTMLKIIQVNGEGFPHLKAFLKGYYNIRREI